MKTILLFLLFSTLSNAQINLPYPIAVFSNCDDNLPIENEFPSIPFDLSQIGQTAIIFAAMDGLAVNYYPSLADANADINPIPNPENYSNIVNPQTIWLRVYEIENPSNFGITTATLEVRPLPGIATSPVPDLVVYQSNTSNISFNLNQQLPFISTDPNVAVTFYETQVDAQNGVNQLGDCYVNSTNPQLIYFQVVDINSNCSVIGTFSLIISSDINSDENITFADPIFLDSLLAANTNNSNALDFCGQPMVIDVNADGQIQMNEAARVSALNLDNMGIGSLEGIANFTNLTTLHCGNNSLLQLPVSGLQRLSGVFCEHNLLSFIDLSQTAVIQLRCNDNQLLQSIRLNNEHTQVSWQQIPQDWSNNPMLSMVCTDENETDIVNNILALNGYSDVFANADCSLGLNANYNLSLGIVPNPVHSFFEISADKNVSEVTIFDATGRCVFISNESSNRLKVDASAWNSGLYFVRATLNGMAVFTKLLKN